MKYGLVDANNILQNVIDYVPGVPYAAPAGLTVESVNDWIDIGQNINASQSSPPPLTVAQRVASALEKGLVITSTSNSALNGTYSLSVNMQSQVNALVSYMLMNGTFPNGQASLPYPDSSSGMHTFSVVDFKNFATAFANYVASVMIYGNSNGATGSIPSNQVTIP